MAEKAAVVAESLAPGAVTSAIALVPGCTAISSMAGAGSFARGGARRHRHYRV